MQNVTMEEFQLLVANKKELACSRLGAKVLEHEQEIIKVFPAKNKMRFFYIPDIERFASNALLLQEKNIKTVTITGKYHVVSSNIFYVIYKPVIGISLREHLQKYPEDNQIMLDFAKFLAHLHDLGIYFRSIHFGNIIIQPDKEFALIDITTMYFKKKPLSVFLRIRNFKIFSRKRYKVDFAFLKQHGVKSFLKKYLECSQLSNFQKTFFWKWLLFRNQQYKKALN